MITDRYIVELLMTTLVFHLAMNETKVMILKKILPQSISCQKDYLVTILALFSVILLIIYSTRYLFLLLYYHYEHYGLIFREYHIIFTGLLFFHVCVHFYFFASTLCMCVMY